MDANNIVSRAEKQIISLGDSIGLTVTNELRILKCQVGDTMIVTVEKIDGTNRIIIEKVDKNTDG